MNTHTAFYPQLKEMVINSGYESVTDGHVKYRDMMNALKQGEVKSIQVNEHAADLPDVVFAFYEHVKMQNLVQKDWYSGLIISQQHAPSTLTKMILKKKIGTENISGADLKTFSDDKLLPLFFVQPENKCLDHIIVDQKRKHGLDAILILDSHYEYENQDRAALASLKSKAEEFMVSVVYLL
ncbi:MAG: hypothetical protein CMH27_04560 [Micavibrio sp.]|nr:hypothetical protein [Micavibrio sp.]|tara:strand:+ start:4139 stop:4684 length:546 start_codon:yes stop_codon:yes gene_type:complete